MRQSYAVHAIIVIAAFTRYSALDQINRRTVTNIQCNPIFAESLVFRAGTRDSKIRAFDKDTTGGGKLGTPVGDAYVAFALPLQ